MQVTLIGIVLWASGLVSCSPAVNNRYALARALGPGTCLRSDLFEAGGQQFQLEVFPAGLSADTSHHLSVFLTSPGAINPNHVLYEMAVVDQVRQQAQTAHTRAAGCSAADLHA